MLSRTAQNLYWMGRYIERADATARLVEMGPRMTMLRSAHAEWRSVGRAAGIEEEERHRKRGQADPHGADQRHVGGAQ